MYVLNKNKTRTQDESERRNTYENMQSKDKKRNEVKRLLKKETVGFQETPFVS